MALSAKIRAICKLYRGTRSHKGTFEQESVSAPGTWQDIKPWGLLVARQRGRPWGPGIPPSQGIEALSLVLASSLDSFIFN